MADKIDKFIDVCNNLVSLGHSITKDLGERAINAWEEGKRLDVQKRKLEADENISKELYRYKKAEIKEKCQLYAQSLKAFKEYVLRNIEHLDKNSESIRDCINRNNQMLMNISNEILNTKNSNRRKMLMDFHSQISNDTMILMNSLKENTSQIIETCYKQTSQLMAYTNNEIKKLHSMTSDTRLLTKDN